MRITRRRLGIAAAAGTVGCELVARAEPDGYTMLMGHIGTLAISPLVYPHHSYDPVKGWTAIAYVANVPNVLAVNAANLSATSVQELVGLAKAKAGALAYGTRRHDNGLPSCLGLLRLCDRHGIPARALQGDGAIRERSGGRPPGDRLHGRAGGDATCQAGQPAAARRLEHQTLRGLRRAAHHRGAGLCRSEADHWYGITGPAGIDPAVALKLNAEINRALASADVKARLEKEGGAALLTPPATLEKLLAAEIERWRPVVGAADIRLE